MKPLSKNDRHLLLGGALSVMLILVWWVQVYAPQKEQRDELSVERYKLLQERDRLEQRREKLSGAGLNPSKMDQSPAGLSSLVVPGKDPEEVSAFTQLWVQEFTEGHDISLSTYQGISPSKWRDYPLCRVQFQMNATMQGLSDLLESLDRMQKPIRIENINVDYRRSRENDLRISLELGALFVEGFKK